MTQTLSTGDARSHWREVRDRAKSGEDVVIERHGQPDVVVIRYEDYEAVREALEEVRAVRHAERALAVYREDRRLGRPYGEIRTELVDEGLLDE